MTGWDDRRQRERRQKEWRDRDERERRAADARFAAEVATAGRTAAAAARAPDPLQQRVDELFERKDYSLAWRVCLDAGTDPERYGIVRPIGAEKWEAIAHHLDATPARYYDQTWMGAGLSYSPSALISVNFAMLSTGHLAGHVPGLDPAWGRLTARWGGSIDVTERTCELLAHCYRRKLIERARARYRAGFYADPFATEPMRRPRAVA